MNFGWEYVWHCHILSHEEMDFMHSLVFAVPPTAVNDLTASAVSTSVTLDWFDRSTKELQYTIERATDPTFTANLATFTQISADPTTTGAMTLTQTVPDNQAYWYRVTAVGPVVGDTVNAGFPTMSANSVSNTAVIQVGISATPEAPIDLSAVWPPTPPGQPAVVNLAWTDMATTETHFVVERCSGLDCTTFAALPAIVPANAGTGLTTFVDTTVASPNVYSYRVMAVNGTAQSAPSNIVANVSDPGVPVIPVEPMGLTVAMTNGTATLSWSHPGGASLIDFTIQRANNASFTLGVTPLAAAAADRTAQNTVPAAGSYYYRIRANGSTGSSIWTNGWPFPVVAPPLVIVSLTADRSSPFIADGVTSITWTAVATGGFAPLQYQFWSSKNGGAWSLVQDYGASNTYSWVPTGADFGQYQIRAYARNAGSTAVYDARNWSAFFRVTATPLVVTSINPDQATPFLADGTTAVTWTATTTGGYGTLTFQFWRAKNGGAWSLVQDYGTSNTYSWVPTGADFGQYQIRVYGRNGGSIAAYDARLWSATFTVTGTPLVVTSINPDQATPFLADGTTAVTWTATTTGGYGTLTFQFWRAKNGGALGLVQDWGTSNTYSWVPTVADFGNYQIRVYARNGGSIAVYDARLWSGTFTVQAPAPPVINSITANPASPLTADGVASVTWTANTTGGFGTLTWQFWRSKNGAAWVLVQDYSTSNTYAWTPVPADVGQYQIRVYVRNQGSVAVYDARNWSALYVIQ